MAIDWLIVGLGNPGNKYAQTRHNIGFMVVEELAHKHSSVLIKGKGDWLEATIKIRGKTCVIMLPQTYMNASGIAVKSAMKQYDILPRRVIMIVDEFNFEVGTLHLKQGGSDGGHNGTASMITEIGSPQFYRLRCGISRNFGAGELVEYVLKPFEQNEIEARNRMIQRAVTSLEYIAHAGIERAMQEVNSAKKLTTE